MRKVGVFLLSVILFVSLLGFALSVSAGIAVTHPQKVKNWLNQSNVYGAFVTDAINQAKQSAGDDSGSSTSSSSVVSLNDAAVQQIARSTFSSKTLQGDVNTFVNSNYDWLKGKTSTPDFKVDLTSAKQTFADKVGDYVQTYLTSLPVCTDAQLSEINTQDIDPLDLTCRPAGVLPSTVSAQVSDDIANSNAFLSNPVITATNLDPKGDTETTPYYQNLSGLPKVYQFGTKIPLIAGIIALASLLGVIFVAKRHRQGLRVAAIVLALAGVVLVIIKFLSNHITDKVQHHVLSNSTGQVHKALVTFVHLVADQLVKIDLWFGIGYLVAAAIIIIILRASRERSAPAFLKSFPSKSQADLVATDAEDPQPRPAPRPAQPRAISPADELRFKRQAPTAPPVPSASASPKPKPKRRKPPKLIQ
ncbi:MAG TPA: hypothetical protein VHC21_00710 [Candidatus Saccharimonadales bacterium]|nr:hypothetical protein [Candidatus Saccharimonadales bacterium]